VYPKDHFDFIWASPDCRSWSLSSNRHHNLYNNLKPESECAVLGEKMLHATHAILDYFQPYVYCIEMRIRVHVCVAGHRWHDTPFGQLYRYRGMIKLSKSIYNSNAHPPIALTYQHTISTQLSHQYHHGIGISMSPVYWSMGQRSVVIITNQYYTRLCRYSTYTHYTVFTKCIKKRPPCFCLVDEYRIRICFWLSVLAERNI
jgi:hypothetical protein